MIKKELETNMNNIVGDCLRIVGYSADLLSYPADCMSPDYGCPDWMDD